MYQIIKREKKEKKGKGWTAKRLRRDESGANGGEKNAQFQNLDHIEIPTVGLKNLALIENIYSFYSINVFDSIYRLNRHMSKLTLDDEEATLDVRFSKINFDFNFFLIYKI